MSLNDTLMFDTIRYDPGGHFNTHTGYYRCPENGVYAFYATVTIAEVTGFITMIINRSGTSHAPHLVARNAYGQISSGSTSWIIPCNMGEEVSLWLRWVHSTPVTIKGDDFSTFSGFMLASNVLD
jgi:hypothetical protein